MDLMFGGANFCQHRVFMFAGDLRQLPPVFANLNPKPRQFSVFVLDTPLYSSKKRFTSDNALQGKNLFDYILNNGTIVILKQVKRQSGTDIVSL